MTAAFSYNRKLTLVCIFFVAATLVLTWPLASNLVLLAPGFPGDNLFFVWLIEWYRKAILQLHVSPWFVPTLNFPEGYSLGYTEFTPLSVFTAMPVTVLFGAVAGYNAVILSTFVLSGLGVYLWVYRWTRDGRSGLIAGTIFAYCTYRMNHLGGHITLEGTQWLPLYFLTLHSVLASSSVSKSKLVLAALFLIFMSMTAPYYLYMSLVLSIAYVAGFLLLAAPSHHTGLIEARPGWSHLVKAWLHRLLDWKAWRRLAAICGLAAPLCLLALWPYIQLRLAGQFEPHTLAEASFYSASLSDFLVPMSTHLMIGPLLVGFYHGENALYLGVFALCLAGLAVVTHTGSTRPMRNLLIWLGLCAVGLAMGISLHWLNVEIRLDLPALVQQWWPYPQTFVPLPGYLLYRFVPFYASMRVWMRYGLFVMLFVSILAGLGAAWLLARIRSSWQCLATAVILALVLLDSYRGPIEVTPITPRQIDQWLAIQPGQGAVAAFPFDASWTPAQTFFAGTYNKPYIAGHFAAFRSPQFERLIPIMQTFPDAQSMTALRQLGVQYLIVDAARYDPYDAFQNKLESFGVSYLTEMDGIVVYAMPNQ